MLQTDVEGTIRARCEREGYLFPDYPAFCFANVPHTVASLLGVETGRTLPEDAFGGVETDVRQVVVVLLDGFGLSQWKREYAGQDFLASLTDRGTVTPLTSIYPSETSAAMTTFHSGELPARHGVIGWNVYEPTTDEAFEALPFTTKDGTPPDGLSREEVADAESFYPLLEDAGIECHQVLPFESSSGGTRLHQYDSLDEVGATLARAVRACDGRAYVFAYLGHLDHVGHVEGTDSPMYQETLAAVCEQLERGLVADLDPATKRETLLVVTADHGHLDTDPESNVDLSGFPVVTENLRRHADGTPIRFAGSPRNLHLHLRSGSVETVREHLRSELDARIFRKEDVLDRGLFGDIEPSATFRRRLGDLVVSHRDQLVWWGDVEPDELQYVGVHGGLHPDEMLVPFAAVRLDDLRE